MLKIHNLHKTINQKIILNAINLEACRGEIVFLLGASGVGKSTLLRILNNLESYERGSITLDDTPFENLNKAQAIGLVFQHFNLFPHLTVAQNITLALEKVWGKPEAEALQVAQQLLAKYQLADKSTSLVSSLSGGQKQRLAIARAVAINPYVVCLDEPTSALDPVLTSHVAQQIQHLADEGRIVLAATHDMNLVLNDAIKGTVYLMQQGSIVEGATTQQLKNNPAPFQRITQFMSGKLSRDLLT